MGLFILNYASYLLELAEAVRNFDWTISTYNQSIGFLPGPFYVALYFAQLFLVLFLVQFALRMINRSIGAKRWFLRLIPWFAILSVFTIYRSWWVLRNEDFGNDLLIYGTEALLVVVFSLSCLKVYSTTWMRAYFGEPITHSKIESQRDNSD
ncbi:hypothetical protein [Croceimicrobium hydrocarbonivorans]|uniref:Uncharacterized protein n=1 Tax=Croceimicrobium hydrocarbonivorans TaxID=2761580 RepID=A0A7H0VH23_9FLAO|nr:hypothetical protein [Croceimicrobium hydrocarbonivorans]QNR25021.1 hypothetical protein H4K34_04020 [Croceimicrobium hydrocarbonivorans]